jgi:hypothetical protein
MYTGWIQNQSLSLLPQSSKIDIVLAICCSIQTQTVDQSTINTETASVNRKRFREEGILGTGETGAGRKRYHSSHSRPSRANKATDPQAPAVENIS